MTSGDDRELLEVRRILYGGYEEASPAERQAILRAASPALANLRRRSRGPLPRHLLRWLGLRLRRPSVRLAAAAVATAILLFFILSRHELGMHSTNVYTVQELESRRAGAPLGTSAAIFQGLQ